MEFAYFLNLAQLEIKRVKITQYLRKKELDKKFGLNSIRLSKKESDSLVEK